jgi:hypothetical protein
VVSIAGKCLAAPAALFAREFLTKYICRNFSHILQETFVFFFSGMPHNLLIA